jgi:hypothetical protein
MDRDVFESPDEVGAASVERVWVGGSAP